MLCLIFSAFLLIWLIFLAAFFALGAYLNVRRKGWRQWLAVTGGCFAVVGAASFFGPFVVFAISGFNWLPNSFEWPVGYAQDVVSTDEGLHVVPLWHVGRIQVYDANWSFLTSWPVEVSGRSSRKLLALTKGRVEVITSRGHWHYVFDMEGRLLSKTTYEPKSFDSFPSAGESMVVPTAPWLWPFTHPGIGWVLMLAGMIITGVIDETEKKYFPIWQLKKLALAMHAYHEKHGRLPPAALYNQQGIPLLSWRVLLLPHLGQEELFHQFKLDEPWDSLHNIQLLPKMPEVFECIPCFRIRHARVRKSGPYSVPYPDPHTTFFQVFVGKGAAFEGQEGLRLKEDFPRLSHTVLIAEAEKAVPWTKPEDLVYDENTPLPKLGGIFQGFSPKRSFHVCMADGKVKRIRRFKEATLRAAIMRNGQGPLLWEDK